MLNKSQVYAIVAVVAVILYATSWWDGVEIGRLLRDRFFLLVAGLAGVLWAFEHGL